LRSACTRLTEATRQRRGDGRGRLRRIAVADHPEIATLADLGIRFRELLGGPYATAPQAISNFMLPGSRFCAAACSITAR
jgi:hypothetical protein